MAQLPHVEVDEVTPVDLTVGLEAGCFIAMPRRFWGDFGVLYATRETAPTDPDDWFHCHGGQSFAFTVASSLPPTWVLSLDGGVVAVALARDPQ